MHKCDDRHRPMATIGDSTILTVFSSKHAFLHFCILHAVFAEKCRATLISAKTWWFKFGWRYILQDQDLKDTDFEHFASPWILFVCRAWRSLVGRDGWREWESAYKMSRRWEIISNKWEILYHQWEIIYHQWEIISHKWEIISDKWEMITISYCKRFFTISGR